MPYQVAAGWNNAGALADLTPQPATPKGFEIADRANAASGDATLQGEVFVDLVYTLVEASPSRATLETQLGLSATVGSSKRTMRLLDNYGNWANFNVWVEYPQGGSRFTSTMWNGLTFRVRIKEAL